MDFYTGIDYSAGRNLMRLDRREYTVPEDFFSTDAFTDYAIQFLDEARRSDRPFFLYLAHNAPHFPLHARRQQRREVDQDGHQSAGPLFV